VVWFLDRPRVGSHNYSYLSPVEWPAGRRRERDMNKGLCLGIGLALIVSAGAYGGPEAWAFSTHTLHGSYVLQVIGFDRNDGSHIGQIYALGVLNLDGQGGVSGTLNFTSADSGGDQAVCTATLDPSSSYSVTAEGTGVLTLAFPVAAPVTGPLSFAIVVVDRKGREAKVQLTTADVSAVTICGEPLDTLTESGQLTKRHGS
jgi:hypothetical protein